jgi:hypothetical protein
MSLRTREFPYAVTIMSGCVSGITSIVFVAFPGSERVGLKDAAPLSEIWLEVGNETSSPVSARRPVRQ